MPKLIPKRISAKPNRGTSPLTKPELLSPAGDWDSARAAVENGADAIFFGLDRFNARMRGKNFTVSDLPELMAFLHGRGVKGYVTFNTLVFSNEIDDARQFLSALITAGVDAAIVQDVGVCRLIRTLSPDFPIHASTQMSVTSEAGVAFANDLGCSVVVLARECSLEEVAAIKEKSSNAGFEVPIEIFVHGALCVAYSGQCLTSESLGGRSANRGECAQACRLPYDLISDGEKVPLGERRYLLSPQDLAGIELMPDIIRSGVATLKIEGRLKAPQYVAAVTKAYREAIDNAWIRLSESAGAHSEFEVKPEAIYSLEMTFSRGLRTGWLEGIDNRKLVHARYGKKRGPRLGVVERAQHDSVRIRLESALKVGDGVVFDRGRPDEKEEGGRIVSIDTSGEYSDLRFLANSIDWSRVAQGDIIYKTSDPSLDKALKQTYSTETPRAKRPLTAIVNGEIGLPLSLTLRDEEGRETHVESTQPLERATTRPLTTGFLEKQIGRMGNSPFVLERLDNRLADNCLIPVSALNQMRRESVDTLISLREKPKRWTLVEQAKTDPAPKLSKQRARTPALIPYVRTWEQLEATLALPYTEIYLELEDPKRYARAVELVRNSETVSDNRRQIWVAPPRIFKTGEDWIIKQLLNCEADGYLVRNHEHLKALDGRRLRGDFSLNISNHLAAAYFKERWKLERLTASYDLNAEQLAALLENAPSDWFEITLHQHMPMFHMEHCVFCAFLSSGKDFRDCGRPCDTRSVSIRDRVGMDHPLKADAGCRNTVFNAKAQTGAEFARDLIEFGVPAFRIEFLDETPEQMRKTLEQYERLLRGDIDGASLWKALKLTNQLGVTRGTLRNR